MSERAKDFWICVALFLAACGLRAGLAVQLPFPQLDDPAGYIQLARNIASGRGLVSDVLWSYWVSFPSVTHASNEFWMPLASVIMAGSLRLFGDTLLAAQLPGIISGSLLAPLVYVVGRTLWPQQRRWGVLAAVLIVFNAVLIYQSVSADSSAIYTLLAMLALLCGALALERRRIGWMVLAGVLCGLSYLTRSHGLLLPAAIGLITLIRMRREPGRLIKFIAVLALGFAAFLVPWWLRNSAVFGATQPIPLTTIMASRGYEDWFNYTNQPTLVSIAQLGWGTFLGYRVDALLKALGVILMMTFPFGIIGLPIGLFRPESFFRMLVVYCLVLYLGVSVVLPSAAVTGSFYHSAGPFVVWAALGCIVALKYLFARPKRRLVAVGLVLLLIGLGLGQAVLAGSSAIAQSRAEGQQFAAMTRWILENIPRSEPLITTQANTLNYTTGYPTLTLPTIQDVGVLRQLADRYGVSYIVVTERNGFYPMALDDPAARAKLIEIQPGTFIYQLER
jgi:4-amino-4-deoxy-L-arabinose transferase-like glycosyltransferase